MRARWPLAALALALAAACQHRGPLAPRPDVAPVAANGPDRTRVGRCDPSAAAQTLSFVHVNDLHASYTLDAHGESPWARLRGYFEQVRSENPYTLFTDGGDGYEKGSVAELLSRGVATREAMQAMLFDVRVLGNHDFAWGPGEVALAARDPHAPVLASNIRREGAPFAALDYVELDVGCVRVGFFGLLTDPVGDADKPIKADYLPGFRTDHDVVRRARELVGAHRSGVQLMVLLSHLGDEDDVKLARAVEGIDVILGAHTHKEMSRPEVINERTVIIQAGTGGKHVARLDLRYRFADQRIDDVKYQLLDNERGKLPADPSTQAALVKILQQHAPEASQPLGQIRRDLAREGVARLSGLAALVKLRADAALVDEDAPQQSWSKGPISLQAIVDTFPVQRQPPDTPGFTSFYVATVPGATLAQLRRKTARGVSLIAPESIDPARSYRLALPKHAALHPERAGEGVAFEGAQPGCEIWEALDAFARVRNAACQHIDDDEAIKGCARR